MSLDEEALTKLQNICHVNVKISCGSGLRFLEPLKRIPSNIRDLASMNWLIWFQNYVQNTLQVVVLTPLIAIFMVISSIFHNIDFWNRTFCIFDLILKTRISIHKYPRLTLIVCPFNYLCVVSRNIPRNFRLLQF